MWACLHTVQAGCSGVSGPISQTIHGEEATETNTRQENRTGYAKYSLHRLVIQLLLTIGSRFRNLIHKERVWDILSFVQGHGFLNVGINISSTLLLLLGGPGKQLSIILKLLLSC